MPRSLGFLFKGVYMKVKELRDLAKDSQKEYIADAMVEIYKALPKAKKEDLDDYLKMILSGEKEKAKAEAKKNKNKPMDFHDLSNMANDFITLAREGLFLSPNRTVPKKRRSQWRFEAKRYIKGLLAIPPQSENFSEANMLLEKFFDTLSYSCGYYLFNSENPFGAIGMTQAELFEQVVARNFAEGFSREMLSQLYSTAASCYLSYDCLHEWLLGIVSEHLDRDQLPVASEEIKKLIEASKDPQTGEYSSEYYNWKSYIQKLDQEVLSLAVLKGTLQEDLSYYFVHSTERDKEVSLYCALTDTRNLTAEDYIFIYEYGIKKYKIKPRKSLTENYEEAKKEAES